MRQSKVGIECRYGIKLQDLPIKDNSRRYMDELYSGWSEAVSFLIAQPLQSHG